MISEFLLNKEVWDIVFLTLIVTFSSTAISVLIAVPLAIIIAMNTFRGKSAIIRIINTLMGLPPVVAGLLVYIFISSRGPLGFARLLFTPYAMVLAQIIIITPIVMGISIVLLL